MGKIYWGGFATLLTLTVVFLFFHLAQPKTNGANANSEFRVGVVVPLSGRNARYGQWIREGLELAASDINSSGGVSGQRIKLFFEDDKADPGQAVSALSNLIGQHDVQVVYGSWASSAVLAMAPLAEREEVVILASAISPKISEAGDYVFRMQPSARQYIRPLAPYAYNSLKARNAAILFINNDFGLDQAEVFGAAFKGLGGKLVASDGYEASATDFRAELTKLRGLDVDTVFLASYAEVAQILRQAKQIGLTDITFLGSVPTENPDLFEIAGDAADGVVFPSHFNIDDPSPEMRKFVAAYEARFEESPEGLAALAYDGLFAIAKAAEAAGATDGPAIKDAMYTTRIENGVTGTTSFDENGDVLKDIVLKTVSDNRFVAIEASNTN